VHGDPQPPVDGAADGVQALEVQLWAGGAVLAVDVAEGGGEEVDACCVEVFDVVCRGQDGG
jgi:hypothetical protein